MLENVKLTPISGTFINMIIPLAKQYIHIIIVLIHDI